MRNHPIPISLPSGTRPSAQELALWQSETAILDYRHTDIQQLRPFPQNLIPYTVDE